MRGAELGTHRIRRFFTGGVWWIFHWSWWGLISLWCLEQHVLRLGCHFGGGETNFIWNQENYWWCNIKTAHTLYDCDDCQNIFSQVTSCDKNIIITGSIILTIKGVATQGQTQTNPVKQRNEMKLYWWWVSFGCHSVFFLVCINILLTFSVAYIKHLTTMTWE